MINLSNNSISNILHIHKNFRPFDEKLDLPKLKSLLTDEWDLGQIESSVSKDYAGLTYAMLIIAEAQHLFTLVNNNNEPIGFVGCSNKHLAKLSNYQKTYKKYHDKFINLIDPKNVGNNELQDYYKADIEIENYQHEIFDTILEILIIDKKYKGYGYGRKSINLILDVIKELNKINNANIGPLSIYTTNFCNLDFYLAINAKIYYKKEIERTNQKEIQYVLTLDL